MTNDTSETHDDVGTGCEWPPPDRRPRRPERGERTRSEATGSDSPNGCGCVAEADASGGDADPDGSGDSTGPDGFGDARDPHGPDGDAGNRAATECRVGWLKLWRVVLLLALAVVRLLRTL